MGKDEKSTILSLFDLEKIGRELSTALQTAEPSEGVTVVLHEKVREIINKHKELIDEVYDIIEKIANMPPEEKIKYGIGIDEELANMLDNLTQYVFDFKRLVEKIESGEYVFKPEDNAPIYVNNALKSYMGYIDDLVWDLSDYLLTYYTLPEDLGMKVHRVQDKVIELNKERKEISYFNEYIKQMHEINKYIRKTMIKTPPNLAEEIMKYLRTVIDYMDEVNRILSDKNAELQYKASEVLGHKMYYEKTSLSELEKKDKKLYDEIIRFEKLRLSSMLIKDLASVIYDIIVGRYVDIQKHYGIRAIKSDDLKNVKINVIDKTPINIIVFEDNDYKPVYLPSIRDIFKYLRDHLGRKVGYMVWYFDELSIPALINDLANAVHVLAEELSKLGIEVKYWKHGKCEALEEPDERLMKLCVYWDKYTDENYREGMYIDEDYNALFAELMRDRGEFRVGSAEGHATEVSIRDNTIRIRYYDYDHDVNRYIKEDFEECGLICKELDDGVECEGTYTGEEQLKCIASTMAEATSMDIRLRRW